MVVKVLIIDDDDNMVQANKAGLSFTKLNDTFETTEAYNCKDAYDIITNPANTPYFNVVFLDYSLAGTYPEKKIYNGEDLGVLIRQLMPNTKIVVFTASVDVIKLHQLAQKINPEGLIIKSDFKIKYLDEILETILKGGQYLSDTARKAIHFEKFGKGKLDSIDLTIIKLIAQGYEIKSIAPLVHLTEAGVKKRKSRIHDILGVFEKGDQKLLEKCRELLLIPPI